VARLTPRDWPARQPPTFSGNVINLEQSTFLKVATFLQRVAPATLKSTPRR